MKTALEEIRDFKCNKLQELLNQCPSGSQNLFQRMYGTTNAQEVPEDKIDWAIQQCENTLKKIAHINPNKQ